jgi:[CysO sulfur-carrier protein]-S-L-cysteine hydrolase
VDISKELLDQIVAHAQELPDEEVCGVVAVGDLTARRAIRVYRTGNVHRSDLKFEIDPRELLKLYEEIQAEGWELGAIYHSHVRSAPYPSQTDIGFAAWWPDVEWLIVGLSDPGDPELRSYLIDGAQIAEVPIEVSEVPI